MKPETIAVQGEWAKVCSPGKCLNVWRTARSL